MQSLEQNASSRLIDLCVDYISKKDASYLCREDAIVYFASSTGRDDDAKWMILKLNEVVRIIRATKLPAEFQNKLKNAHVIAACQELDKVYDYGVKTQTEVAPNVFNFNDHSGRTIYEEVMDFIAIEYRRLEFYCLRTIHVLEIFHCVIGKLDLKPPKKREVTKILNASFSKLGYQHKFGVNSMFVKGEKIAGLLMGGHRAKELKEITTADQRKLERAGFRSAKDKR